MNKLVRLHDIDQWNGRAPAVLEVEQFASGGTSSQGRCPLCQTSTHFEGEPYGDIRERLACANCGANARQRAAFSVLHSSCSNLAAAHVYATEQASAFYRMLRSRVGRADGGEFGLGLLQWLRVQLWMLKNGLFERLRIRDLTALDFPDAALDAVISLDVLEHVPDYRRALGEVVRVLRPGGVFVFTVPFYHDQAECQQIAWLQSDGTMAFAEAPEYHGDPVSGGVLCFHHFGWDLLKDMREAGFVEAEAVRVYLPEAGLPVGQWVLCGRR